MEQLIDGEIKEVETVDINILRDKNTKELVNKEQPKRLRFGFDKRLICADYDTVPYGYC